MLICSFITHADANAQRSNATSIISIGGRGYRKHSAAECDY